MTEKKKLALMRKRNEELSKKIDTLMAQLETANSEKENYAEYSKELEKIKSEFENAIKTIHSVQEEYEDLISKAKIIKREVYESAKGVGIPLFTKIRLFAIKHRK